MVWRHKNVWLNESCGGEGQVVLGFGHLKVIVHNPKDWALNTIAIRISNVGYIFQRLLMQNKKIDHIEKCV